MNNWAADNPCYSLLAVDSICRNPGLQAGEEAVTGEAVTREAGAQDNGGSVMSPSWAAPPRKVPPAFAALKCKRLLVVHATQEGWDQLATALADQPFLLDSAHCAAEAEARLQGAHYDAVLLNPDLPDRDGLAMVPEINCPVIIISEMSGSAEILKVANSGAADFVIGSVAADELAVRLWKIILNPPSRRRQSCYRFDNFEFDSDQRLCISHGRETRLTRQEAAFLARLIEDSRHFATYDQLIAHVWGNRPIETQNLRVLAAQLRRKIEKRPDTPELLLTIMGRGYRLSV